uniref:Uncharacterized protein n=1 Tax=Aquisalinus luteolus TaxID=1566827 RepID=A0A8J3ERL9_9PROT|nr:hypothetical protein GCM10011355_27100 [Aquisalinus luteolus]
MIFGTTQQRIDKVIARARARIECLCEKAYGGWTKCPWCRQIMHAYEGTTADDISETPFSILRCGNCKGTSIWQWGLGWHFVRPADRPIPDTPNPSDVKQT